MNLTFIKHIGDGGFGSVDKVKNDKNEVFARKTFQINQGPNFPSDQEDSMKLRFRREAIRQGEFSHPNIVSILGTELEEDPPYYLMPLAIGSLKDAMEDDHLLGGHYMNALLDVMAGLEAMHELRIYHRDLKPANVLVFDGEKRNRYAIGDFGLISLNHTMLTSITPSGLAKGSDYYTAPEIVKSLRNASIQSDIYSFGCILHDFVGNEERIVCNEIRESGVFSQILLNCTRKDKNRRFKSIGALRDAILSIPVDDIELTTDVAKNCLEILEKSADKTTEAEWNSIISFLEDEDGSKDADKILLQINIDHIKHITSSFIDAGNKLGLIYSEWIKESSFSFERCDGLANRLEIFIANSDLEVKSESIMALLSLGTGHNRWYVERKFTKYVGNDMDEKLARRLAMDFRVAEDDVCKQIRHLERSISYSRSNMNPILVEVIRKMCR